MRPDAAATGSRSPRPSSTDASGLTGRSTPSGRPDTARLFYTVGMKYLKDRVLLGLIGLLMLTVTLFLAGILPYPFGILVLLLLIVARLLSRR